MKKEKILTGLMACGEWIQNVCEDEKEKHIQLMFEALDEAYSIIATMKPKKGGKV